MASSDKRETDRQTQDKREIGREGVNKFEGRQQYPGGRLAFALNWSWVCAEFHFLSMQDPTPELVSE